MSYSSATAEMTISDADSILRHATGRRHLMRHDDSDVLM